MTPRAVLYALLGLFAVVHGIYVLATYNTFVDSPLCVPCGFLCTIFGCATVVASGFFNEED